jgi:small subunit ribosomal protein S16
MVRIRLRRTGLKHQPTYRIVAADKESPRDGRFLEILGFYNPRTDPPTLDIKEDRVFDWMNRGAQPSESVVKLLNSVGALERYKRFKAGEAIEVLQAEATAIYEKRTADQKTRRVESR